MDAEFRQLAPPGMFQGTDDVEELFWYNTHSLLRILEQSIPSPKVIIGWIIAAICFYQVLRCWIRLTHKKHKKKSKK